MSEAQGILAVSSQTFDEQLRTNFKDGVLKPTSGALASESKPAGVDINSKRPESVFVAVPQSSKCETDQEE